MEVQVRTEKTEVFEKGNEYFPLLAWCIRALGKREERPELSLLFVKGEAAFATDGVRLHECPLPVSDGTYEVRASGKEISLTPKETRNFPDVLGIMERFLEKAKEIEGIPVYSDPLIFDREVAEILRALDSHFYLNLKFLMDLISSPDKVGDLKVLPGSVQDPMPVVYISGTRNMIGLLMPKIF